ncbi:integrase catalytic domain-containing protein [Trichonephila clavipes]|nr:integrase catalytic domain-containing protein [Trichonephila clavipes]
MLKGQSLSLGDNKPFAVRSDLGWIVAGNVPSEDMFSSIAVNSIQVVTDELVSNFWKLDSVPEASLLTSEERACEDHFIDTHVRNEDGRYVVRLPFHSSPSKLGDSRESAIRRFKSLEHSLIKKPAIYSQYRDFMHEYLTLEHMELVPKNDYAKREVYYLPHHAVLRDSSTTKLRVVFDASAKSTSGYSLNDILMVGPRVQRDVYPILLSFRTFQIAVCADLEKMFRQIRISSEDTNWQRILWRDNPKETVKEYRLTTVTYGTSCAPYLSTRTLTQLAFDERERYPLAPFATLHHFYVDDLLSGAATEKEAVELVWQLKEMMKKGGFNLRKWQSNSEIVIKEVAENKDLKRVQNDEEIKILGIQWNPKSDFFSFSVSLLEERCIYSKRDVLSEIARVFDPLGLLSPCIVFMKILLQELWKLNLEWDEPIPEDLNKQWTTFRKELHLIEKMKIPRTIAWTDSTITLAWLKTEPYRWQPFVANRVSKIQTTIPSVEWCHVSGIENPADLGTRGLLPSQLVAHDQWIHGPLWLNQPMNETSSYKIPETFSFPDNALKEKRSVVTCVAKIVPLPEFIDRISSFTKLVRVCAWILRFIKNSRSPFSRTFGYLKSSELHTAVVTIVRLIQQAEFPNEFKCLFQGNSLSKDNKLLPLNLFCDSEGVLRVGGRLSRNTRLSYDQKHPMLLPKSHEFTRRVINFYHITYLHAGPQLTLSLIRQKFWFVDGRSVVRHTLKKCLICFKMNLRSSQLMGDLPPIRFQQIRPFESTGLDFAGPLTTKCAHKRSVTKFKSYICLFICTATKAVHLELVSDLSTAAFLAALRRFIARRSCPSKIISDNGSNFKGASSHLRKLVDLCLQEEVQNFLSLKGIEWSFIPPYTPHFGGLWESAIKSAKQLLIKATNSVLLNFEECSTLLIQIEACLNSRPLTELSPDPSDFTALTPAHFLVGGPIHQFPEPSQPSRSVALSERWNLIQRLRQYFWDRWSTEYLHRLQPRSKWWRTKPNLQLGDMVIVEKEKTAPLNWTLGRINKLFFGPDQKVRGCECKYQIRTIN